LHAGDAGADNAPHVRQGLANQEAALPDQLNFFLGFIKNHRADFPQLIT
jgi:hypothetical protein